jgi:4-hydroxy-2-oxoglutarate aldolase
MLLEGIFPPLTTCFHGDGRPYWYKLEENVEHYSRTPVSGLVLLGSTGEAVMLSDEESREVLRVARRAARPEKVLVAGVGRESVSETLRLAEYAAQLDYDAVLVRTPHYYRPQMGSRELLTYYQVIADRSPLPVVLYNIPLFTAYDLPVAVIAELAMHPNIAGIKDSSSNIERIRQVIESTRGAKKRLVTVTSVFTAATARMLGPSPVSGGQGQNAAGNQAAEQPGSVETALAVASPPILSPVLSTTRVKTRTKEIGFQVLVGSAQNFHDSLQAGATGGVLAIATFAPQASHEIYAAWKEGNEALAAEKQARVVPAGREISRLGIPGIKHALDLNGYFGGVPRMPLLPLTAGEKRKVEEILRDLRN